MNETVFCISALILFIIMSSNYPSNFLFLGKIGEVLFAVLPISSIFFILAIYNEIDNVISAVLSYVIIGLLAMGAACSFRWKSSANFRAILINRLLNKRSGG